MWLRQSTATTQKFGPFVDATDGVTAETALTISQADIRLSKNGGAFAQSNNVAGATHDENGYYGVPLDTTDTGTLGTLRVAINESGALPVWQDFMVVPANVWDSLFGADKLQVDLTQIDGAATSGNNATLNLKQLNIVNSAGTALIARSTGGDGNGAEIWGSGGGHGLYASAGPTDGHGIIAEGKGAGKDFNATTTDALQVTVTANNDKTGYSLSAAAVQAIWDALISALTTAGSIGKLIVDNINATISSRATQASVDAVKADTAAVLNDTGTDGVVVAAHTAAAKAEIEAEANDALIAQNLDHLVKVGVDTNFATTVHLDSVVGQMADNGTAASFDRTTDSLEAIRDRGDAAWITGAGGSAPTAGEVADAVWEEARADHVAAGSFGAGVASVQGSVTGSVASVTGTVTAALTVAERDAIADAHLDRVSAIETGLTVRQAHRLEAAAAAGKLSGAATNTVTIRNAVQDSKPRITATVDADGNRSAVATDVS